MPYVKGNFCFPNEVEEININDVIVVKPTSVKSKGKIINIPPLSLISENCSRRLDSIFWVDGVRVKGKERIYFHEGIDEVNAKIKVLSPEFLPGYTLQKLLEGKSLRIAKYAEGVAILAIDTNPLVLVEKDEVHINTTDYQILFKLLAYSVYYYISSEYSEEI